MLKRWSGFCLSLFKSTTFTCSGGTGGIHFEMHVLLPFFNDLYSDVLVFLSILLVISLFVAIVSRFSSAHVLLNIGHVKTESFESAEIRLLLRITSSIAQGPSKDATP